MMVPDLKDVTCVEKLKEILTTLKERREKILITI